MRPIDPADLDRLPGIRLKTGDTFRFRCHPAIGCFNRCCRNLNLFLYPYDALRLKQALGVDSDRFLDDYTDVVMRDGNFFPDVLLRMADNPERTCPFLSTAGCTVYDHRPDTCRTFPLEQGLLYNAGSRQNEPVFFYRPPSFCLGRHEPDLWRVATWIDDQQAQEHNRMTVRWARVRQLFASDPWGREGPQGPKGRMAFMAAYNLDRFREFVLGSSFLERYKVKAALVKKLRADDRELLKFGFEWIELFVWGQPSKKIRPRR
jgi:Fe-S-cluster containining protein